MTKIIRLEELADRCEAASGPDREIDGWIWAHLKRGDPYVIGSEPGRFPRRAIYGERMEVMIAMGGKDAADYIGAPKFTASIDAAMTLVPEELEWSAGRTHDNKGIATVWYGGHEFTNEAATPALALCAAALRSLAQHKGDGNG